MQEISIGIDIGGTNTAIGIVSQQGEILEERVISTQEHQTAKAYVARAVEEIKNAREVVGTKLKIRGIGIGAPNGNFYAGTVEEPPNLPWKGVTPLADLFKEHFDLPVTITNDANAAAIGEMMFGGARDMKNFVVITLGTGLGSGLVVNGELVYGHDGFAGELGHVSVRPQGRQCACGRRGCLETYVSAPGIKRTVMELLAETNQQSALSEVSFAELNAKQITLAAENGDAIAKQAYETTGRILGQALANTVAHLSPQAVFLFGGLSKSGGWILQPTQKYMEANVLPIYKGKVAVRLSELNDRNGAILGAAALVWKESR